MGAVKRIIVLLCCCFFLMVPTSNNVCVYANTIVYITSTGEKYHGYNCHYLHSSKIAISLSEAIRKGYTACGYCGGYTVDNSSNKDYYSPPNSSNSSGHTLSNKQNSASKSNPDNDGINAIWIILICLIALYGIFKLLCYYTEHNNKNKK